MTLTKREMIFLAAMGLLILILAFIPQEKINEVFLIVFVGFPLSLMIATDPERIKREK